MLKVGIFSFRYKPVGFPSNRNKGFTLLELILVLLILSVTALMVFPKVSSFGAGNIKRTVRHLSGLIQHLVQESATTKQIYHLRYDLENNAYWVNVRQDNNTFISSTDPLTKRQSLPDGISFEDVITPRHGKINQGEAFTEIFPMGIEKTAIHLKEGEHVWTLGR